MKEYYGITVEALMKNEVVRLRNSLKTINDMKALVENAEGWGDDNEISRVECNELMARIDRVKDVTVARWVDWVDHFLTSASEEK